jgi:hypothetical protein
MDAAEAEQLTLRLWPDWLDNRERSKHWQNWALGRQDLPVIPESAPDEYRQIQERAITPWLGLVVQSLVQALFGQGYRSSGADEDSLLWSVWQANRMDAQQVPVYEAAFTTGISYVAVLPTDTPRARARPMVGGDLAVPEWRPYSSAEMTAYYESPHDDYPVFAIAAEPAPTWQQQLGDGRSRWRLSLFDDTDLHTIDMVDGAPVWVESQPHGSRVCPVVGFVNRRTITGRAIGEVEPYVSVASRIDQDVFDRMVVQRFGSWRVRYATGLIVPKDEEERKRFDKMLLVGDLLTSDSTETQFGSLPETRMDGHLRAPIEDVRSLAAVSQVPPTILTGDLTNISAEALAAIESAYNRKVEQRKELFGEAWEKCFDLSGRLLGVEPDETAQMQWRDMESRSMSQTADAFGKFAQMLEIPVEVLWDKIGFLTDQDRARARELRAQGDGFGELLRELSNGQTSPVGT